MFLPYTSAGTAKNNISDRHGTCNTTPTSYVMHPMPSNSTFTPQDEHRKRCQKGSQGIMNPKRQFFNVLIQGVYPERCSRVFPLFEFQFSQISQISPSNSAQPDLSLSRSAESQHFAPSDGDGPRCSDQSPHTSSLGAAVIPW